MKNKESTYEIKWVNHSTWSDKFVITVFRSGTKNRISNIFHLIPTPNDVVFSSFQNRFRNIFWTQSFYSDTLFVLLLDKMRWDDVDIHEFTLQRNAIFRLVSRGISNFRFKLKVLESIGVRHPRIGSGYSNESTDHS